MDPEGLGELMLRLAGVAVQQREDPEAAWVKTEGR